MFDEDAILDPNDVRRDPIDGRTNAGEPAMDDDQVAISRHTEWRGRRINAAVQLQDFAARARVVPLF